MLFKLNMNINPIHVKGIGKINIIFILPIPKKFFIYINIWIKWFNKNAFILINIWEKMRAKKYKTLDKDKLDF